MKSLHLEKASLFGSILTQPCCLGFGPFMALLGAIGAGFLINDRTLAPAAASWECRRPLRLHVPALHPGYCLASNGGHRGCVRVGFLLKRHNAGVCAASCPPTSQEQKNG